MLEVEVATCLPSAPKYADADIKPIGHHECDAINRLLASLRPSRY